MCGADTEVLWAIMRGCVGARCRCDGSRVARGGLLPDDETRGVSSFSTFAPLLGDDGGSFSVCCRLSSSWQGN